MEELNQAPLLWVWGLLILLGFVLVVIATTGFVAVKIGSLAGKLPGVEVDVKEKAGKVGRITAGTLGFVMIGVATTLLILGALVDTSSAEDEAAARPANLPASPGECAQHDAVLMQRATARLEDGASDCVLFTYGIEHPGVAFIELTPRPAELGLAFEVTGPSRRQLGNGTLGLGELLVERVVGFHRPGSYDVTVSLNGAGSGNVGVTLNLKRSIRLQAAAVTFENLTGAGDIDSYVFTSEAGAQRRLVIGRGGEAHIDVSVLDPEGFGTAAGVGEVRLATPVGGEYFVQVEPISGWNGSYSIGLDPAPQTTTTTTTRATVVTSTTTQTTATTTTTAPTTTTTSATTTTTTTTVMTAAGLPRSFYREDPLVARDELLAAGFFPRLIDVCSGSVEMGLVRQIVTEQITRSGIDETILDDREGLRPDGQDVPTGSEIVVKVSTGVPCGTLD